MSFQTLGCFVGHINTAAPLTSYGNNSGPTAGALCLFERMSPILAASSGSGQPRNFSPLRSQQTRIRFSFTACRRSQYREAALGPFSLLRAVHLLHHSATSWASPSPLCSCGLVQVADSHRCFDLLPFASHSLKHSLALGATDLTELATLRSPRALAKARSCLRRA